MTPTKGATDAMFLLGSVIAA